MFFKNRTNDCSSWNHINKYYSPLIVKISSSDFLCLQKGIGRVKKMSTWYKLKIWTMAWKIAKYQTCDKWKLTECLCFCETFSAFLVYLLARAAGGVLAFLWCADHGSYLHSRSLSFVKLWSFSGYHYFTQFTQWTETTSPLLNRFASFEVH